jgi:hypothetical protein
MQQQQQQQHGGIVINGLHVAYKRFSVYDGYEKHQEVSEVQQVLPTCE